MMYLFYFKCHILITLELQTQTALSTYNKQLTPIHRLTNKTLCSDIQP